MVIDTLYVCQITQRYKPGARFVTLGLNFLKDKVNWRDPPA